MEKQPRLTRAQVIARLREHADRHGYVSTATLDRTDKIVLRSIPLHFVGLAAARFAAGVAGPPYQKPARKTGPKPGSKPSNPRVATWSRARVIDELRRLHRTGQSTTWQDRREFGTLHAALRAAGLEDRLRARRHGGAKWTRERVVETLQERAACGTYTLTPGLHRAVQIYFGGAANARAAAGTPDPAARLERIPHDRPTSSIRTTWTRERVIDELRRRAVRGEHAMTSPLYRAARLLFGGARPARAAAGVPNPIDARRERARRDKAAFARRHRNRGWSR